MSAFRVVVEHAAAPLPRHCTDAVPGDSDGAGGGGLRGQDHATFRIGRDARGVGHVGARRVSRPVVCMRWYSSRFGN